MRVVDESPSEYFEARGFEVRVEERVVHEDLIASGLQGAATFYVAGRRYYCVDLVRGGSVVAPNYGIGATLDEALRGAQRRFGSEQE